MAMSHLVTQINHHNQTRTNNEIVSNWAKTNQNFSSNFTLSKAIETNVGSSRVVRLTPTKYI